MPFIFNDLYQLPRSLLARILRKEGLATIKNPYDLLKLTSKTDIGFIAKSTVKHAKNIKESEVF